MSRKFKVPLNLVGLTTDPGSATNGDLYFNTVSNKVRYYTQNTWQDLGAAAGGATVQVSTTIPATATEGKLWYDNDDAHLYVFDGTYWVEVSIGPVGPAGPTGAGVATAGTTGQYLVKSSNNNYETTWSTLPAASLTSTDVSRLTGATSNLQTQINTLSTNLGNTLDDYVPIGDVGVADGVASLDSAGKIPIAQLGNLIDGAPTALDTLNELAAAINDDASYAAGVTTALGTKISKAGGDIITSSLASTIPLRIKGAASQTANLQEWQNSAGTVLSSITPSGDLNFASNLWNIKANGTNVIQWQPYSGTMFLGYGSSNTPITVQGSSGQTGDLQKWTNSSAAVLAKITSAGQFIAYGDNLNNFQSIGTSATLYNGFTVTTNTNAASYVLGTAGASESNFNVANSFYIYDGIAGAMRFKIMPSGLVGINSYSPAAQLQVNTSSASTVSLIAKGTTSQTANLQEWQNSAGTVIAKVNSTGELTTPNIALALYGGIYGVGSYMTFNPADTRIVSSGLSVGSASVGTSAQLQVTNGVAGTTAMIVKGASSQTANLQEWQNSSGTVLAKITPSGALDATAITVNGSAISGGLSPVAVSTNITMVANTRYFVDTANDLTLTLPATPALGAEIELYDASNNAFNNDVVILRNGQKINGLADDAALDINGFTVSFIYTGSTYGWRMK